MKIAIRETPGRCRWCRCTYERACPAGCSWANRQQTLCSACVGLDRLIRTGAGRQSLAEILQEHEEPPAAAANNKRSRKR